MSVQQVLDGAKRWGVAVGDCRNTLPTMPAAFADAVATDGVLRNLVDNAIAAIAPMKGGTILISGKRSGGAVELSVKDSGIGFEPGEAERLFEKFVRLDTSGGRDAAGTGLGLYIVRRFMHFENGEARAHSEGPGKGATFVVTWPAAVGQDAA